MSPKVKTIAWRAEPRQPEVYFQYLEFNQEKCELFHCVTELPGISYSFLASVFPHFELQYL
jgi:hypothetical protein